jgi:hypothetical protein
MDLLFTDATIAVTVVIVGASAVAIAWRLYGRYQRAATTMTGNHALRERQVSDHLQLSCIAQPRLLQSTAVHHRPWRHAGM